MVAINYKWLGFDGILGLGGVKGKIIDRSLPALMTQKIIIGGPNLIDYKLVSVDGFFFYGSY
jgi:hypothetical protein